jgi:hypothetical protein
VLFEINPATGVASMQGFLIPEPSGRLLTAVGAVRVSVTDTLEVAETDSGQLVAGGALAMMTWSAGTRSWRALDRNATDKSNNSRNRIKPKRLRLESTMKLSLHEPPQSSG